MGMWTFGLAMIFAYVSFLPGQPLAALIGRTAKQVGRLLRRLGVDTESSARPHLRAAGFALGLTGESPPPNRVDVGPAASETPASLPVPTASLAPIATSTATTELSPSPALDRVAAPGTVASGHRDLPPTRPSILVVEGRLKRQAEVQEYFLKHGFRCHVASEVHQARSMLAVIEFDALIVTSSWFPEDELAAFHDGLIGGGTALPASVFLLGSARDQTFPRFPEMPRHRVLIGSLSLRELRLLVLEVLGLTAESLRPYAGRRAHSRNGHRSAPADRPQLTNEELPPETTPDMPSTSSAEMDLPL